MKLLGGKTVHHLLSGKQPIFPTTDAKFTSKRRMRGGWVQAEDLYGIEFHLTVGHPVFGHAF